MRSVSLESSGRSVVMSAKPLFFRRLWIVIPLVLLCVGLDQFSKYWALRYWSPPGVSVFGQDWMALSVVYNDGAAFGLFLGNRFPYLILGTLVILGLGYWLFRRAEAHCSRLWLVAVALMCGGIVGNLIDRSLFARYVVDFIEIGWLPVFNLADACLFIGALLIFADSLKAK